MASQIMIPYFDLASTWEAHREEIEDAIHRVLSSGRLILDAEVEAFEAEFAAYIGTRYAVGVGSGTDALTLALRAQGIGEGAEVITVGNAGVPPVAAIRAAGAMPRLVDVDAETLLLDVGQLERSRTARTRAILPVHLYGQPVDLDGVMSFAEKHGLAVIEDCAQAHGATYRGRHVGVFGNVGCFSFYPTKNLGAFGDGGLCATDDAELAARLRSQRMYGFREDGHAHEEGMNSRLDEIQAAILRVKLQYLDATIQVRRDLAARYREALAGSRFRHPGFTPGAEHAYHLFVVETPDRGAACAALDRAGIGYGIHYPTAVHRMEAYSFLGPDGGLPSTERTADHVMSLPLYPGLDGGVVIRVVETLRSDAGQEGKAGG